MLEKPFTILICALGGEGGGVLTEWLVNTARVAGLPVQATSIPGVAQRTGATTYYLEMMLKASPAVGADAPIFGLSPLPGQIDLLISSELLETGRQISNGMSNPLQTYVISSNNRSLTTVEKMGMGDSRVPDTTLIDLIKQFSRAHHIVDMALLAKHSGTIISSVMLGCIGASALLPLKKEHFERAIQGDSKQLSASQKASLRGFSLGWESVEKQLKNSQFIAQVIQSIEPNQQEIENAPSSGVVPFDALQKFPVEVHPVLNLGYARLVEYQDTSYADLYLERVHSVWAAEKQAHVRMDPLNTAAPETITPDTCTASSITAPITQEAARWTALWMAFDDIVRVAELKNRKSRFEDIRKDTKAQSEDIIRVYDHFKPGVSELAGLLPQFLSNPLLKWEKKRALSGLPALELKLKLHSSSITGALVLLCLSSFKWLRKHGTRYHYEQLGIQAWLKCIIQSTETDKALGLEVAACGRLIKGYASTNARAHENLNYILNSLSADSFKHSDLPKSEIVRQARLSALKEESGSALDHLLKGLGAPARPPKEQPIRWMKRPLKV
jgi:indolepyruvate ferredoxin oxidoreductase beta subunit